MAGDLLTVRYCLAVILFEKKIVFGLCTKYTPNVLCQITDAGNAKRIFHQSSLSNPMTLTSNTPEVLVRMSSDLRIVRTGFRLSYTQVTGAK